MELNNRGIGFIRGYLDALSDINGGQREFIMRLFLLEKNEESIENKLKTLLEMNTTVLDTKNYKKMSINCFLRKLIAFKPFSGLYPNSKQHTLPNEVLKEYQDYILFHLSDYIDFALDEEGIDYPYKSDIDLMLLEDSDKAFIVLVQKVKDRELIWIFFYNSYKKEKITHLFKDQKILN